MNRVAIDIDETLVHFLPNLAKYHGRHLPSGKYSYVYRNIFDIPEHKSRKMVLDFYNSEEFYNLKPIIGARKKLEEIRKKAHKVYVVSGRQDVVREKSELWLETYFPGIFDDLILTNSYTIDEIPKVEICKSLKIDTIIDDDYKVCLECMRNGVKPYNYTHYPMYPWTSESDLSLLNWHSLEVK
uniref:FCP1 homology domain-containing protein n=1 Tax=viral metagenome TaxID=1070528 RepID=A0A6C0JVL3_9ZZZZ